MALHRLLTVLLVLVLVLMAGARPQDADVAAQDVPELPQPSGIQVPEKEASPATAPETIENAVETDTTVLEKDSVRPETVSAAPEKDSVAPEKDPATPEQDTPTPEKDSTVLETDIVPVDDKNITPGQDDPLLAARNLGEIPEFDETAVFVEPDAIKPGLNAKCQSSDDCAAVLDSDCIDGLCSCKMDFIPSKRIEDKCLKVPVGLGDDCEEETQCNHAVPYSECRESKCSCPHNYIFDTGSCWEKQMLGGNCNISIQCGDIEFATCVQGVCSCVDPYIPSPINKCLQPAGDLYRAPCVEDIQCTYSYGDEARCSNNMCRCTNNYHFNGKNCVVDKKLGEVCEEHEECAVADESSRMCLNNSCTCATGYKSLPGESICIKSSGEELAVSLTWILCIVAAKYYLV